jgi:hypothetical protein
MLSLSGDDKQNGSTGNEAAPPPLSDPFGAAPVLRKACYAPFAIPRTGDRQRLP